LDAALASVNSATAITPRIARIEFRIVVILILEEMAGTDGLHPPFNLHVDLRAGIVGLARLTPA